MTLLGFSLEVSKMNKFVRGVLLRFGRIPWVELRLRRDLETKDHESQNPAVSNEMTDESTSARNSGFERISKCTPGRALASRTTLIDCAVRQGTVLFSTMIFEVCDVNAICLVAASTAL